MPQFDNSHELDPRQSSGIDGVLPPDGLPMVQTIERPSSLRHNLRMAGRYLGAAVLLTPIGMRLAETSSDAAPVDTAGTAGLQIETITPGMPLSIDYPPPICTPGSSLQNHASDYFVRVSGMRADSKPTDTILDAQYLTVTDQDNPQLVWKSALAQADGTAMATIDFQNMPDRRTLNLLVNVADYAGGPKVGSATVTHEFFCDGPTPPAPPKAPPTTAIKAGQQKFIQVAGVMGIPANATEAFFNLTATNTTGSGYLQAKSCDTPMGVSSSVNYQLYDNRPNNGVTKLLNGGFCVASLGANADAVVDITGYSTAAEADQAISTPNTPIRVDDSRLDGKGKIPAGGERFIQVAGVNGVPANATQAYLNLTEDGATGPGYLAIQKCGQPVGFSSTINYVQGVPSANGTLAALESGGVCVVAGVNSADVIIDVLGWNNKTSSPIRTLSSPARVNDDRDTFGSLAPGTKRPVKIAGVNGVPADAAVAFINFTAVVDGIAPGYGAAQGCDALVGTSSTENLSGAGDIKANGAIVKIDAAGGYCEAAGATRLFIITDVVGVIPVGVGASNDIIVPDSPLRVKDTRNDTPS